MSSYEGLCPDCQQVECNEACMKATSNVKLLPLPLSPHLICDWAGPSSGYTRTWPAYTPEQMEAYARACVEADRKARADDGEAIATVCLRGDRYASGNFIEVQLQIKPGTELPIGTKLYTRLAPDDVAGSA